MRLINPNQIKNKLSDNDETSLLFSSCVDKTYQLLKEFCYSIDKIKSGNSVHLNNHELSNLIEHPRLWLEMNIERIIDDVVDQHFADDNLYLELKTRVLTVFKLDQA
ncbi:MAG: hypothetical protein OHK0017_02420 [Patescibacteria group bacterium]